MILLVTGAREGFDQHTIDVALGRYLHQFGEKLVIVEGCAPGVDTQAFRWASRNKVPVLHYPAPWSHLGRSAGSWRNRAMLKFHAPDRVIAFHDDLDGRSRGTRDMVNIAMAANIPTHVISTKIT